MEFEGSRDIQTSRIPRKAIRINHEITHCCSRHESKVQIGRCWVDGSGSRWGFHIVAAETKTDRIEQIGCDDVILFDGHHLAQHGIVKELGLVLVRFALRRFVEEISGENAVLLRKIMISAYREKIFVRDLEDLKSKLSRIASSRNRLIWQRN